MRKIFADKSATDIRYQLDVFCLDLAVCVVALKLDDAKADELRSAFVKAALHRVEPEKHQAKGDYANIPALDGEEL